MKEWRKRNPAKVRAALTLRAREKRERYANDPEFANQIKQWNNEYGARLTPEVRRARQRDRTLRHQYGLSAADYDAIYVQQRGRCAICERPHPAGSGNGLVVDHDHKSGKVRELLCQSCNVGIGRLNDDPTVLRAALAYLERHSS